MEMGLNPLAGKPAEVVAADPPTSFRFHWPGSKDSMPRRTERARTAGAKGLIVTLDWPFCDGRGGDVVKARLRAPGW